MMLVIEELQPKDILEASQLINKSFSDSVAPTLADEGIATFTGILTLDSMESRLAEGNIFVTCKSQESIVGVAEMRDKNHLNLLFVEPSLQRKGIGRKLLNCLLSRVYETEMTVNPSLNSVNAYTKYGFKAAGPTKDIKGIRYQPMVFKIE